MAGMTQRLGTAAKPGRVDSRNESAAPWSDSVVTRVAAAVSMGGGHDVPRPRPPAGISCVLLHVFSRNSRSRRAVPDLSITHPANDTHVAPLQPFAVTGRASDVGMPEPHVIDTVTVQVDGG